VNTGQTALKSTRWWWRQATAGGTTPYLLNSSKTPFKKSKDLEVGNKVTIEARINGREWQGKDGVTKWFTSISGYKVEVEGSTPSVPQADSSSYDTYDEYDDGVEDDVF